MDKLLSWDNEEEIRVDKNKDISTLTNNKDDDIINLQELLGIYDNKKEKNREEALISCNSPDDLIEKDSSLSIEIDSEEESIFDFGNIVEDVLTEINNSKIIVPKGSPNEINKVIFIGKFEEINRYRLDIIKKDYEPFIENTTNIQDLYKKIKVAGRPLIRPKQLMIVELEVRNKDILGLVLDLEKIDHSYVDIVLVLEVKDKVSEINSQEVKIINLRKSYRSDFENYISQILFGADEYIIEVIAKRVGYSIKRFNLFREELLKAKLLTISEVEKIIPTRTSISIDNMMHKLLIKDKRGIVMYNEMCDRYSTSWVNTYIKDYLRTVMNWKTKVKKDRKNFGELRLQHMYLYKIVIEVNSINVLILSHFINNVKTLNIEQYYLFNEYEKIFIDKEENK